MSSRHCIRPVTSVIDVIGALAVLAILAAALPPLALAQQPASAAGTGEAIFRVFTRAAVIGTEEIVVTRDAAGWTITSTGRLNAPLNIVNRRLQIRYDPDWKPLELTLDATVRGQLQTIHTTISGSTATSQVAIAGESRVITATTSAEILLPSLLFAPFEALAARLRTAAPGSTILAFAPAQTELTIRVGESVSERIQTPKETIETKRTHVTITPEGVVSAPVETDIWADPNGRLLRVSVPSQGLEVVREDVASVATRHVAISRPNDEQVRIPANGFVIAGTLSKPVTAAAAKLPAVVLVGGSGPTDRDEVTFGIPVFGQLADVIADAGFIVLRYDKRAVGMSGGRDEAATLADYADDARAAVKFLSNQKSVDAKRIAMIGHGEGGIVAMLAAAKEKKIAALALVATPGTTGAELNLEQVRRALDRTNRSAAEKQATLDLQKKIQQAVLTGTGWEQLEPYRRQADTPWFQSFLAFDPARIMRNVRQPVLVVQGDLDTQVAPANAARLEALAGQRKNRPAAQVVTVRGVNHLLVPATTGEADEYPNLKDKRVSAEVSNPIVSWLQSTLAK
jgi:pimeloyl-ACP methyl ester carboxylesterase